MKLRKVVILQVIFLLVIFSLVYLAYPKMAITVDGGEVRFNSINAKVIMISESPDFSEKRYLDFTELKNFSYNLKPGKYYWKADNGIIQGLTNELIVPSEVGLTVNRENEDNENNETNGNYIKDAELVNTGNVDINVTKKGSGITGGTVLESEEKIGIKDNGEYKGEQATGGIEE